MSVLSNHILFHIPKWQVIAAEGEEKSSVALKQAADVIRSSPFALQLRYLQTLSAISAEKNSTIIFPLPIDMLVNLVRRWLVGQNSLTSDWAIQILSPRNSYISRPLLYIDLKKTGGNWQKTSQNHWNKQKA